MKKCSYCGKIYPDTARICELDEKPLWEIAPPPLPGAQSAPGDPRQIIDSEHLKLLAVFQYVFGGFAFLGLLFILGHFLLMSAVISSPGFLNSQRNASGPPPEFLIGFFGFFYFIFGAACAAAGVLNILSANFMRARKHHTFSFVVACLNCLQVPFGTALGVFTIIVLSRESVRAQYPE